MKLLLAEMETRKEEMKRKRKKQKASTQDHLAASTAPFMWHCWQGPEQVEGRFFLSKRKP
jgi:hypothetical protein